MATKRKEHPKKNHNDGKTHCINGHEFTLDNTYNTPEGHRACRACRSSNSIKYVNDNKDIIAIRAKKRRKTHRSPSQFPEPKRRARLKELGWTLEGFNLALLSQKNTCEICGKLLNLDRVQNDARACADHEHTDPPIPRGVLCTNCNAGIGQFKDNPDFLRKAAIYLEKYELIVSDNSDISR